MPVTTRSEFHSMVHGGDDDSHEPNMRRPLRQTPTARVQRQEPTPNYTQRRTMPTSANTTCFDNGSNCISPTLSGFGNLFGSAQPEGEPLLPRQSNSIPQPNRIRRDDQRDGSDPFEIDERMAELRAQHERELRQQLERQQLAHDAALQAQARLLAHGTARAHSSPRDEPAEDDEDPAPEPTPKQTAEDTPHTPLADCLTKPIIDQGLTLQSLAALAKPPPLLSDAGAKLIMTTLVPSDRTSYKNRLIGQAARVDISVIKFIKDVPSSLDLIDSYVEAAGKTSLDQRLATAIISSVDGSAPYVKLLIQATEEDPMLGASGLRMLKWIETEGDDDDTDPDALKREAYDNVAFFAPGVPIEDNKVNGTKLTNVLKALPAEFTSRPNATLKLILGKIPPNLQSEIWAKQLTVDLRLKSKKGEAPPWTAKELISHIATFLADCSVPVARKAVSDARPPTKPTDGKKHTGTVGMWNNDKNFGFIKLDDGSEDAFVHISDVSQLHSD